MTFKGCEKYIGKEMHVKWNSSVFMGRTYERRGILKQVTNDILSIDERWIPINQICFIQPVVNSINKVMEI